MKVKDYDCLLITFSAYLTEIDSIELSILHIITRDELLFDYLLIKIQNELQTNVSHSKKPKNVSAMQNVKKLPIMGSILPNDMLAMEMRFKESGYVVEHFSMNTPITYLINHIESQTIIDYTKETSLLQGMLKFTKGMGNLRFSGTRGAQKLYSKI